MTFMTKKIIIKNQMNGTGYPIQSSYSVASPGHGTRPPAGASSVHGLPAPDADLDSWAHSMDAWIMYGSNLAADIIYQISANCHYTPGSSWV